MTVSRCSTALALSTASSPSTSRRTRSIASVIWTARAVSTMSEEVSPVCRWRASGPTDSASDSRKAITSCLTTFSIAAIRSGSILARRRTRAVTPRGTLPARSSASQASSSTSSQTSYLRLSSQTAFMRGSVYRSITTHPWFVSRLSSVAPHRSRDRSRSPSPVLRFTFHRRFGLRPLAGQPLVHPEDLVQHAVDEARRFLIREGPGQLDGLADRDASRHVRHPQELVHRRAQDGPVHDRHAADGPVGGLCTDHGIQLLAPLPDTLDEPIRELAHVVRFRVLEPEVLQPGARR